MDKELKFKGIEKKKSSRFWPPWKTRRKQRWSYELPLRSHEKTCSFSPCPTCPLSPLIKHHSHWTFRLVLNEGAVETFSGSWGVSGHEFSNLFGKIKCHVQDQALSWETWAGRCPLHQRDLGLGCICASSSDNARFSGQPRRTGSQSLLSPFRIFHQWCFCFSTVIDMPQTGIFLLF